MTFVTRAAPRGLTPLTGSSTLLSLPPTAGHPICLMIKFSLRSDLFIRPGKGPPLYRTKTERLTKTTHSAWRVPLSENTYAPQEPDGHRRSDVL